MSFFLTSSNYSAKKSKYYSKIWYFHINIAPKQAYFVNGLHDQQAPPY